jgi:hypothetical protein
MVTIVWDRDDVLNDLMRCWLEQWWKPTHPECKVHYEDLTENPPHRILNISLEEYLRSLDDFRLSHLAAEMEPFPEVLAWFRKFGHQFRHMALSATPLETAPAAAAWTFRHFGVWVRSFHLIPAIREGHPVPQYDTDKGAYLHWLGKGDVLVDDSPINLESVRRYGIAGLLIPKPWNGSRCSIRDALDHLQGMVGLLDIH